MLVVDISINREHTIVSLGAQRISPDKGKIEEDTECTYQIGRLYKGRIKRPMGEIVHRYGDGAESLAGKAIATMLDDSITSLQEDNLERLLSLVELDNNK